MAEPKMTLIDVVQNSVTSLMNKRMLGGVVIVGKHFSGRVVERKIDFKQLNIALNRFADSVCQVLYDIETTGKNKFSFNGVVLVVSRLPVSGRMNLITVYEDS